MVQQRKTREGAAPVALANQQLLRPSFVESPTNFKLLGDCLRGSAITKNPNAASPHCRSPIGHDDTALLGLYRPPKSETPLLKPTSGALGLFNLA